jgi:Double zinc ribbon
MECPACRHENPAPAKFCLECGARLLVSCSNCGTGAEELLTDLLGQDESLETLKRVLIEPTEGNPFFLEESVQTLVEINVLVGNRGAYRMTKVPDAVAPRPADP